MEFKSKIIELQKNEVINLNINLDEIESHLKKKNYKLNIDSIKGLMFNIYKGEGKSIGKIYLFNDSLKKDRRLHIPFIILNINNFITIDISQENIKKENNNFQFEKFIGNEFIHLIYLEDNTKKELIFCPISKDFDKIFVYYINTYDNPKFDNQYYIYNIFNLEKEIKFKYILSFLNQILLSNPNYHLKVLDNKKNILYDSNSKKTHIVKGYIRKINGRTTNVQPHIKPKENQMDYIYNPFDLSVKDKKL